MIPETAEKSIPAEFALTLLDAPPAPPATPLPRLVAQINAAHAQAQAHAGKAIEHALEAGSLLLQAKERVRHGEWLPWLQGVIERGELEVKERQAQSYMRLASNPQRAAYLEAPSIRAALELLSDPPDAETRQAVHISQGRHEWYSPAEVIEAAREAMGGIDLDPASCEVAQETVRATRYFTKAQDGLIQPWQGCVWLNPPYETPLIGPFIAKVIAEYRAGMVRQAVVLVNNATDTEWFHDLANTAKTLCLPRGRVQFRSPLTDSQSPRQGQVFAYLGDRPDAFTAQFREFGLIVEVRP